MNISVAVGLFFLFLALVFGVAAFSDFRSAKRQWTPKAKTGRRISIVFALVGLGLVLLAKFS